MRIGMLAALPALAACWSQRWEPTLAPDDLISWQDPKARIGGAWERVLDVKGRAARVCGAWGRVGACVCIF